MPPSQPNGQIQVKATDEDLKGRFTNAANVFHADDHFGIDFFFTAPPVGQMVGRIILTPAHMKRLHEVIGNAIKVYEKANGTIDASKEQTPSIGFRAP